MEQRPGIRVGDRERGEVADLLQRHAAAGRLDPDELETRLEAALGARTAADLEPLTHDLPPLTGPEPRRHAPAVPVALRGLLVRWAIANAPLIAIWAATGDGIHDFWPKWFLIVSTVVVVARASRMWTREEEDERPARPPGALGR